MNALPVAVCTSPERADGRVSTDLVIIDAVVVCVVTASPVPPPMARVAEGLLAAYPHGDVRPVAMVTETVAAVVRSAPPTVKVREPVFAAAAVPTAATVVKVVAGDPNVAGDDDCVADS